MGGKPVKHPHLLAGATALAGACALAAPLMAQTLTLQAEEPGSSAYLYAAAFEQVIEEYTDVEVEIIPRGSSVSNTATVNMGRSDLGFANALAVAWGANGILDFEGRPTSDNRMVFSGISLSYLNAVAATDYVEKTGNATVGTALVGEDAAQVLVEPQGSINPVVYDIFLQSYGSSLEDMRDSNHVVQVPSSQMGQRVQDGQANAYIGLGPVGIPDLTEVILARPMTFLTWSDKDMAALREYGFVPATLPANSFDGQAEDIVAPASLMTVIANVNTDEDMVYDVVRTVMENLDALAQGNQAFASWDPETFVAEQYQVIPFHPGAERYYRERGWLD
jgi:hypothetical protein